MSQTTPMTLLFICTHNRCRSILCEAITNHLGSEHLCAFSAGSTPAGHVFPLTLEALAAHGIPTDGLQSQHWDDFDTHSPDLVITVCDSAAHETCPVWLGSARRCHWPLPDPSKMTGNTAEQLKAFDQLITDISQTIQRMSEQFTDTQTRADRLKIVEGTLASREVAERTHSASKTENAAPLMT